MHQLETLDFDDDNLPSIRESHRRKSTHSKRIWFAIILNSLISALFGFWLRGRWNLSPQNFAFPSASKATTEIFVLNQTFIEAPSPSSDAAWEALIPKGRGFILVDSHNHPTPYNGQDPDPKAIRALSIYHQLHCLNELRIGYYSVHAAEPQTREEDPTVHTYHPHSPKHMKHCFDFLRQAIMCAGDTTMETLRESEGGLAVDGWGVEHRCRDYQAIYGWTEKHRASDAGGIQ